MPSLKHLSVILMCLFFCSVYASPPSYVYGMPDLMSVNTFYERSKKYGADKFFIGAYLFTGEEIRGKIKSLSYLFSNYHIRNTGIVPIPSEMTETEQQSILAVFNIATDDEQQSQHLFDKFYANHLQKYYQTKETCNKEYCDFYTFTTVGDIRISSYGYYYNAKLMQNSNAEYMPYLNRISIIRAYDGYPHRHYP